MSILIKGMEMPKSCGYCPLRNEARYGDECYLGASLTEYQKRPDDCPLVPVPPHGRLIEADRLKEVFHRNVASGEAFDQLIDIAPTIIPAEEGET